MLKKVYVTREVDREALELLKSQFEVIINEKGRNLTKDELTEEIVDADAVLCMLSDKIDSEVMDKAKNVKIFANYAVGFNNIDVNEASKRSIVVTNTPDVLTDATADLAWALLFSSARRVVESDRFTREGKFKEWIPTLMLGQEITGKTLGVLGAGRIGKAFAKKSIGFNMKVIYHNRKRDLDLEKELNAAWVDKETLLKESDFLSIHVPLTEDTKHIIGEKELKLMKKTSILINTARGPVIDEKALVEALKSGEIWAAGLDVYENEPKLEEGLEKLNNVVILPHIGSATVDTRKNMALMAAKNIIEVLNGRKAINPVK